MKTGLRCREYRSAAHTMFSAYPHRPLIIPGVVVVLCAAGVSAQYRSYLADLKGKNTAHTVCGFLTLPLGAVELSRGSAASTGTGDAADMALHTAATAFLTHQSYSAAHLEWLFGLRKQSLGACFPVAGLGTFGVGSQLFTAGRFDAARDIDERRSNPFYVEYALGGSYARQVLYPALGVGASLWYIESRLDSYTGRTAALNTSVALDLACVTARVYGASFGPRLSYVENSYPLPLRIGAAIGFPTSHSEADTADWLAGRLTIGAHKTADEPLAAGASCDLDFARLIQVRAGYEYVHGRSPSAVGLSAGAGFRWGHYGADFGWKYQSEQLGHVWGIDAEMHRREISLKTAEDYYRLAERHFRRDRYRFCIRAAKKALGLNPNHWKAHALIARAVSMIRRKKGLELALVYTGNTRGQLLPRAGDAGSIGGLARQAGAVETIRTQYPLHVTVNVGNNITRTSHPLKAEITDRFLGHVGWDAAALGSGEMDFGLTRYTSEMKKDGPDFLCSNLHNLFPRHVTDKRVVKAGPYRFFVAAAVAPGIPEREKCAEMLKPVAGEIGAAMLYPEAASCNLRILVINDTWANLKSYLPGIPNLDIAVCGGLSQRFETPMKLGNTLVVSPGDSGQCVGVLSLRFGTDGLLLSFDNRLIPLTSAIAADPVIQARAEEVAMKVAMEKEGIDRVKLAKGEIEGTLFFLSDRHGAPRVFLKVLDKLAEFALTPPGLSCSGPAVSFACGKLAFLGDSGGVAGAYTVSINGTGRCRLGPEYAARDVAFSPDGQWVYVAASSSDNRPSDIMRFTPEGEGPYPVIEWDESAEWDIGFSPDGTTMVFSSDRDNARHIYLSSPTGKKAVRLTNMSAQHGSARFSPDGASIVYLSDMTNARGVRDLFVHHLHTGTTNQLTRQAHVDSYCLLPRSPAVVYSAGERLRTLFTVDSKTGSTTALLPNSGDTNYHDHSPRYFRYRGKQTVVFCREYVDGGREIYRVNTDGTDLTRIVNSAGDDWLE